MKYSPTFVENILLTQIQEMLISKINSFNTMTFDNKLFLVKGSDDTEENETLDEKIKKYTIN